MRDYYQMSAEDVRQEINGRRNRSQWIRFGNIRKSMVRTNL